MARKINQIPSQLNALSNGRELKILRVRANHENPNRLIDSISDPNQ